MIRKLARICNPCLLSIAESCAKNSGYTLKFKKISHGLNIFPVSFRCNPTTKNVFLQV